MQCLDRFIAAVKRAAQDPDHTNAVFITAGDRLFHTQLQPLGPDRHQARLDIEISAELIPADLGVAAHHQIGPAAVQSRLLAALAPMPAHH